MYLMVPKKQTCLSFGEVRRKKTKSNKFVLHLLNENVRTFAMKSERFSV
ncbi:hypothetical protein SAMN05216365_1568 [Porphyromonadaceae bacterium NLAE-zl-C104]|nr:hypothetical protein SAMN05216357_13211 [Porphyromonadaceae bacterium KH3CP3RA]SFT07367.1 hypothetical protein SAMN05216365_1568 [Porphyromonadaceae bacterium NLAE-zl-C104]